MQWSLLTDMFPNLIEATTTYWRKLDELEADYKCGNISAKDVDVRVKELMAELGVERRAAVRFFLSYLNRIWNEQREVVVGVGLLGILTYTWVVIS